MDHRKVGEKVRQLREARGWSQRQLDGRAGLSNGYVNKLEAGQIPNFSISQASRIAEALGVGLRELLLDEEPGAVVGQTRKESSPELEEIQVNLLALSELDPEGLASLRDIVVAMKEKAERDYLEGQRGVRARRRAAEPPGQVDREV